MGYYINPKDTSKEEWLRGHGEIARGAKCHRHDDGRVLICHVDNGWMTAAGVMFDEREYYAWTRPSDARPKIWFWVKIEDLEKLPGLEDIKEIVK